MKKKLVISAGLFLLSLLGISQSKLNLVIFAEDGDLFYAYINGVRQNDTPESNVKVTNLTSPNISLRIEFNDKTLPQLKQNMALEMGYEHTAKIKRDMKKQIKLRYFGQAPLDGASTAGVATVAYHTVENASEAPQATNNSVTSTTTTTQSYNGTNNGSGSININMGGAGISMNVNGVDPNGAYMNTTTSTTVTSSSSNSSYSSSQDNAGNSSYTGNASCTTAMSPAGFNKMKESVAAKPFSDTKMSTAKVAAKNACLSVNQVTEICRLFNMDDDKLAYAKYAYDYCVDKANYYQVTEVFNSSFTADDLNRFLENK